MEELQVEGVEDLSTLSHLDDTVLLKELKARYNNDRIYTYVGDIVIAVNPFKELNIYGKDVSSQYRFAKKSTSVPHIYAVADQAYQAMLGMRGLLPANQCILISGESGAGKTESTKFIIRQLMELCHGNSQLEQQILQVNPLLEAFGNAQTLMNDNSSRFGKYIQLKFHKGKVLGAKISEYLLEKSRLVQQSPGEENFHVFFYMFAGKTEKELNQLHLQSTQKYRFLSQGISSESSLKFHAHYGDLLNALDLVGFTDQEQKDMFTILAGILQLGDVIFTVDQSDAAMVEDSNMALTMTCRLFGIDQTEVSECLTSSLTVTKGDYVRRNYSLQQSEDSRDAMAKSLYGRLFGWIVNKINCLVASQQLVPPAEIQEIGILDIFGFEHFENNSFEQACINLANEQLQYFFNQYVFKIEQEEYIKEGIDWTEVKFADNQLVLDLFLVKPIGILSLLDEESFFPKATDRSFVEKLNVNFWKNPHFTKSKHTNCNFSIYHYAGTVTYNSQGWLEKNRDTFPSGIMEVLQMSKNKLLKLIFKAQITRTGSLALQGRRTRKSSKRSEKFTPFEMRAEASKRKVTVGGQFRSSLQVLMDRMRSATPVFVRCLKPNHLKVPQKFDDQYILTQLNYTGMLQTTQIRRAGFAVRPSFQEFVEKYKILLCKTDLPATSSSCKEILQTSQTEGWHVGKSKVFLKSWHVEKLTEKMNTMGKNALHIQRVGRGFLARRRIKMIRLEAEKQKSELEALSLQVEQLSLAMTETQHRLCQDDLNATNAKKLKEALPPPCPAKMDIFPDDERSPFLQNDTSYQEDGVMQASDDGESSSDEVLDDDFQRPPTETPEERYSTMPTRILSIQCWFQETQRSTLTQPSGKFSQWFHGIISRRQSETLLLNKGVGCFIIRVSETRFGYSLSFRAENRCRHYMIDQLPNGKYIIIGEPKVHRSLPDLVAYHQKHRISNWNGYLTVPCGQEAGQCDYAELVDESQIYHVLQTLRRKTRGSAQNQHTGFIGMRGNQSEHAYTRLSEPPGGVDSEVQFVPRSGDSEYSRLGLPTLDRGNARSRTADEAKDPGAPLLPRRMYSGARASGPTHNNMVNRPLPSTPADPDPPTQNQTAENRQRSFLTSELSKKATPLSRTRYQ